MTAAADGQVWLHIYDRRIPAHLHGANHTVVFFRGDLEAAFGELFHLPIGGGR